MTTKDKKELYTVLWKEARRLYKKYNLCKAGSDTCLAYQLGVKSVAYCCHGCDYIGKHGCKVQSLACAVFCCYLGRTHFHFSVDKSITLIQNRVARLRKIAITNDIPFYGRSSKKENFQNPNYETI